MPLSGHLDHAGIFADDFGILEGVFSVLAGDGAVASKDMPAGAGTGVLTPPWYDEPVDASVTAALDNAAASLEEMGYAVERRDLASITAGEEDCLITILSHDMALNRGADYDRAGDQMSDFLRGWVEAGRRVTEEQYDRTVARRAEIVAALEDWLTENGVVLTAANACPAPLRSEGTGSHAPQRLWTLAGWPALAMPGLVEGAFSDRRATRCADPCRSTATISRTAALQNGAHSFSPQCLVRLPVWCIRPRAVASNGAVLLCISAQTRKGTITCLACLCRPGSVSVAGAMSACASKRTHEVEELLGLSRSLFRLKAANWS